VRFDLPMFKSIGNIYLQAITANKTISTYVPVFLQKQQNEERNPIGGFVSYIVSNSTRLFFIALALVIFIVFLLVVSAHPAKKEPFRERKKWSKILKMDNSK